LQAEAVKNLLPKRRIIQNEGLTRFDMPVLTAEYSVGRTADHIEREAYEKGYAAGEQSGFEMGEQKAQVLLDKVEALISELTMLRQKILKEIEPQCVELAVGIARKIIINELTTRPEEIVKMTQEALLKLERTGQITIKVNPSLFDFFSRHKPDLLTIHPDIVFDADPSVSRFGTIVIGPVEDVVTDVDEQIKNLIKDMADRHGCD
jgi:flagellar assembly protein FliH